MPKLVPTTFISLYAQGLALADEVDDYIEQWHLSSDDISCELHEFLGLSLDEYKAFVADDTILPLILKARSDKQPLHEVIALATQNMSIAARAQNASALRNWLDQQKELL